MRGLKSTLALLAVLVGLGAYIYFVTWKQPEGGSGASNLEKVFPGLSADKLNEISVRSEAGEVTVLKKDANGWQMASPVAARASDPEVQGVTSTLGSIDVARVIDENPTDLKQYGLDAPKVQIEFKGSDSASSGKLTLGERTPTSSSFYATKNDEKRVFLVNSYHETPLNRGSFQFRDKAIVQLQRDKIDGAEVVRAGQPVIELKKAGTDSWSLAKPFTARADSSAIESLIARVETAQMKSVAVEQATPADLKKYGLDKPDVAVNILMGGQRSTLLVGGKADDGNYAKDAAKPAVVVVEGSLIGDLKKDATDYRSRAVFDMRSYNVSRVEVTRGTETVVLERTKGEGENAVDKWRRVSPNPGDADTNKAEVFMTSLTDTNIVSFLDSKDRTGLDAPVLTVSATFDDGKRMEKVTFGKNGDKVYVARADDPGAGEIMADRLNEANMKLDDLLK